MRVLAALLVLLLLGTFAPPALHRSSPPPANPVLTFDPVPLDSRNLERKRAGRLVWLGGWELERDDPRFGGISALHVEGELVTALSDAGTLMRFTTPTAIPDIKIEPLSAGPGSADVKGDRDAESLAVHGGP